MSQHPSVAVRTLARASAVALALLAAFALVGSGCDSTVTSVGAWEPLALPSTAGQSGGGGAAGKGGIAAGGGAGVPDVGGEGGESAQPPSGLYLEAESGELSGGFTIESDPNASGGEYILPPPVAPVNDTSGTAQARYSFSVDKDGDYVIWGRIYSPDISSNRFRFQVDGGNWYTWRISVGNIWYWNYFHIDTFYNDRLHFQLTAGSHTLLIANEVANSRLDRLYITAGGDEPPGNATKCNPPHSIDPGDGGDCQPSCGAQAPSGMHTTCVLATCAGKDPSQMLKAYDCGVCCIIP